MPEAAAAPVVHPTAVVQPGAELGPGVEIGPWCVVEAGVVLGAGVRLTAHVHLLGRTEIGAGTVIRTGSVIGGEPQDRSYAGERTRVRIGARCSLHEHVTVHRATGEGETVVGDEVVMMAGSHVGHNARLGHGCVLVNCASLAGHSVVGDGAILSAYAAVHQFGRIGRLALLGGASMATLDVPPFSIATGSYPLRWRGPNTVGLRRAGFPAEERDAIRAALQRLFASGESPRREAESLQESPHAAVRELAEFVLSSRRGVCTAPSTPSSR
ncbi:MAG: acyl-ACP--UDP-N-acetylglucosamine O-acyltransferase [Planctomycetota bacterium]|nr:MAG: acyl-ACP--UDP-N-acetylglucosamine O-acyltransferase [Planctomycetota bacterium]